MQRNRVSAATRYPLCRRAALEKAKTNRDFCKALASILEGAPISESSPIPFKLVGIYVRACEKVDRFDR